VIPQATINILLFGDDMGVSQLLRHVPQKHVKGIVAAKNRPQYHESLRNMAFDINVPFFIQPMQKDKESPKFLEWVSDQNPDLIWVNSYSMIVREEILTIPRLGGINIHGALLPQYRGCNPWQWAILNEESEIGVTLHEMSSGIDEGNIINQKSVQLFFEDTWKSVQDRVGIATDRLIIENLPSILSGKWKSIPQNEDHAKYYRRRTPEDGLFKWEQSVRAIYNLIRALVSPHPGAFYFNKNMEKVVLDQFMTPAEIVMLKYSDVGGGLCRVILCVSVHFVERTVHYSINGLLIGIFPSGTHRIGQYLRLIMNPGLNQCLLCIPICSCL